MSCEALKLKGCEIEGSTFKGRTFTFSNRNIINDSFKMIVKHAYSSSFILEVVGLINESSVYFSYDQLQNLKSETFYIEFWGKFNGLGNELLANEVFKISKVPCDCDENNQTSFSIDFGQTIIDYSVNYSVINIGTDSPEEVKEKYESNTNTNVFTDAEKQKLAGLDSNKFYGKYPNFETLENVIGESGAYAYVGGVGENDQSYIWDDDDNIWVLNSGAPNAETPASIKIKYESNPDTNAFTDDEKLKLSQVEAKEYKEIIGYFSQSGAADPVLRIIKSDFNQSINFIRQSPGDYNFSIEGLSFNLNKVFFDNAVRWDPVNSSGTECFIVFDFDNSSTQFINIKTYINAYNNNIPVDDISNIPFNLKIYN